jgi:hypothetical protein
MNIILVQPEVSTTSAPLGLDCVWNVMAHAQKPDFVFRRNGRVHLNRRRASVQSTAGSRGVRINGSNAGYTMFRGSVKVLATHSIRQFPLHFPSRASSCAITFQLDSTNGRFLNFEHYPCFWTEKEIRQMVHRPVNKLTVTNRMFVRHFIHIYSKNCGLLRIEGLIFCTLYLVSNYSCCMFRHYGKKWIKKLWDWKA